VPGTPPIYAGSSDPLLEWALRQSGSGLAVLAGGSKRGLDLLASGGAVVAGVHLLEPESGDYNVSQVKALVPRGDIVVLRFARRIQGLILAPGNPHGVTGLEDVARLGLRLARRGAGAGSQVLLEILLDRAGLSLDAIETTEREAETEGDLASMISEGTAECAFGIEAASRGLGFVPLWPHEEFDLVMRRRDYFEPPVQALLGFAATDAFAARAAHLGGYDLTGLGSVRFNA
jgi:molybdate-binding protein